MTTMTSHRYPPMNPNGMIDEDPNMTQGIEPNLDPDTHNEIPGEDEEGPVAIHVDIDSHAGPGDDIFMAYPSPPPETDSDDDVPELEPTPPLLEEDHPHHHGYGEREDDDEYEYEDPEMLEPAENSPYLYCYPPRREYQVQQHPSMRFHPNSMMPWITILPLAWATTVQVDRSAPWG